LENDVGDDTMRDGRLSDTPNVLIVYYKKDDSIEHEALKRYLANNKYEGSKMHKLGSIPHGPWYFVNLDNKICVQGRIGIGFAKPYFDHAVTVYEFMHIDERYRKVNDLNDFEIKCIFDKYKGKKMLEF
jgi:hypothetical protein